MHVEMMAWISMDGIDGTAARRELHYALVLVTQNIDM
jgi:hypothetical protein